MSNNELDNKKNILVPIEPPRFIPKNQPVLDKYGRILVEAAKVKKPPSKNDIEKDYPKQ
jgi:hypothetical protein